jgi:hypothetical protein
MRRTEGSAERSLAQSERDSLEKAPLHARIEQMLTEGRVILPGAQALLGFQLIIVLTDVFEKLPYLSRVLHGLALLSVALSVILLITPAALHRIVWAGQDSEALLQTAGIITVLSLLPLAFGMVADAYIVFALISASAIIAATLTAVPLICLLGLWFVWPLAQRWRRRWF